MNRGDDKEHLLSEVLAEGAPVNLREDLLTQTLQHVRHRRHARQVRQAAAAIVLVLGLGLLLWPRPQHPFVQSSSPKPYALVQTQPLLAANIVKTIPLNALNQIASSPTVAVISTATEPHLAREIDDADLLSLAAPNPVVLVRLGPHSAELVFAHTTDEAQLRDQAQPQ